MELISYDQIPMHHTQTRDNQYILRYHRPYTASISACLKSMTILHNETANFWTHFLPTLLAILFILSNFLFYPLSFYSHQFDWGILQLQDRLVLSLAVFGMVLCFGTSSFFHIFSSHSGWSKILNQFDLLAIMFMNTCLAISWSYFLFANNDRYYVIIFNTMVGVFSMKTVFSLTDPAAKVYRVLIYIIAIVLLAIPCLLSLYFDSHLLVDSHTKYLVLYSLVFNTLGGLFYASRIPERFLPGYFDLFGSSHMCMHVCTATGVFCLYESILQAAIKGYTTNLGSL